MIPFILLALGLGAAAAYAFSPSTHQWVDAHVEAVKDALHAHDAASAHLDAAHEMIASTQPAPPLTTSPVPLPPAAAQHVAAAAAHVASSAQLADAAKKAATAIGDHPVADAAHRVADLVAALTAAKADETEATATLTAIQPFGGASQSDAQALRQRIATAQNREAVLRAQLEQLGQSAGAAIQAALTPLMPSALKVPKAPARGA